METIARNTGLKLLAALALASIPTVAQAQVVSADYRPMTKTEAILGGTSALAAITAQQGGAARPAALMPAAASSPALSYYRPAVVRPAVQPASLDRPNIFNSVALSVGHSPLDARFRAASASSAGSAATAFANSLRNRDSIGKIEAVNAYVNAHVRFVDDIVQFGTADRWQSASETLARGRGDCEDYALAKRAMLRSAGIADRDLYLVVLKDLTRRADHSVLVVRANGRFLVLDNGSDRIVDSASVSDYRPILTFTAGKVWTHGYRRDTLPPVTYASLQAPAPVQLAEAKVEPALGTPAASALPEMAMLPMSLASVGL